MSPEHFSADLAACGPEGPQSTPLERLVAAQAFGGEVMPALITYPGWVHDNPQIVVDEVCERLLSSNAGLFPTGLLQTETFC